MFGELGHISFQKIHYSTILSKRVLKCLCGWELNGDGWIPFIMDFKWWTIMDEHIHLNMKMDEFTTSKKNIYTFMDEIYHK